MNFLKKTLGVILSLAGGGGLALGAVRLIFETIAWKKDSPLLHEFAIPLWIMPLGLPLLWIGFVLRTPREEIVNECVGLKKFRVENLIAQAGPPVSRWKLVQPFLWPFFFCWWLVFTVDPIDLPYAGIPRALLWSALLIAGVYAITLLHELGHLLAGRVAGMNITGADIGGPPFLFTVVFSRYFIRVGSNPWVGMAYIYSSSRKFYRLRRAAMLLGGPVFHLLAIVIFAGMYLMGWGPAEGVLAAMVAWVGLYTLFAGSLLPLVNATPIRFPSDGYQFCGNLLLSEEDIRISLAQSRTYFDLIARPPEETGAVLTRLHELLAEYPDCSLLRFHLGWAAFHIEDWATAEINFREARRLGGFELDALHLIETQEIQAIAMQGRFEEVEERCLEVLTSDSSKEQKVELLDLLACLPFTRSLNGFLEEADKWSTKALELDPSSLTLQGTRGSVLVERGRMEEARAILSAVREQSKSPTDQGITSFYLAIIELKAGRRQEADALLQEALSKCRAPWLVKRALALKRE